MSEQSAKPYLIRAICEWCGDNALTPYLAVKVNDQTRVPAAFVKNGEIVLNVSTTATRKLTIDNEWIQFTARFNGASQEVAVPINAVSGIFAKETGYGFAFSSPQGLWPRANGLVGRVQWSATTMRLLRSVEDQLDDLVPGASDLLVGTTDASRRS